MFLHRTKMGENFLLPLLARQDKCYFSLLIENVIRISYFHEELMGLFS